MKIEKDGFVLGISDKKDGSMKGNTKNKNIFLKREKISFNSLKSASLSHGRRVVIVDSSSDEIIDDCDALITDERKIVLSVTVADCLPIYFLDKQKKVVAIAHAGWRGVVSGISLEVLKVFKNKYDSDLSSVEVFIGPHIKNCHFEIKEDIFDKFRSSDMIARKGKKFVNLSKIIVSQLTEFGIKINNINIDSDCTYCESNKYFSYRRDKPLEVQAMLAYILLK